MHGYTSTEGPSKVEPGPSEHPQYSNNYPPPNNHPRVVHSHIHYPPPHPPPAPSTAHVYHYSSRHSPYGLDPGVTSTTRLRTSIACGYCRKRKMRCSGKDSAPGGKCQNCLRMNQECIFSDIRPASAVVPAPFVPGFPPREVVYGYYGERWVQAQNQNRDSSSSDYGTNSNLAQDHYPQHLAFRPPPPGHRGNYHDGQRHSFGQRQDEHDSFEAYAPPGKTLQEFTSRSPTSDFSDLNGEAFFDTDSIVPINSDTTVDGYDISENWRSQTATGPEKPVEELSDRMLHTQLAIPSLPLPQGLDAQSPAAPQGTSKDHDWKYPESTFNEMKVRLEKIHQALKEPPLKLPDPARLRMAPLAPSSSPTLSSDIDVDSVSGDSEGQLDRNSQGYCLFSRVFCRLAIISHSEAAVRGESNSSGSKGKQVAKGGSASSSTTRGSASTTGGQKNRRQGDDHGDERKDKHNEPPRERGKTIQFQCDERSQFLACPYWKADSRKYWDCFLKKNDTIAHLKQHLTRRHTPKYYCQICYQTFRDFDLFDSHALERSCTRGPSAKLEGISQQQKNQLSLKSKGSVEQQWYTVWSILFPDMEPPATIYIYSTQSEDFCRIQEFAQREGVAIMMDEVESNGLVVRPDASNQLLRSTVQRAMVSIFRSYSVRREPNSEADEPIVIQDLQPDNDASLQQESTTGGQIEHGNLHSTTSADMNRIIDEGMDNSGIERLDRASRCSWPRLPTTTPWLPRGAVQDNTEDEPWGPSFPDEPAFGESSSGNDLPFNFESSDMLDLDALLRDVISTEA